MFFKEFTRNTGITSNPDFKLWWKLADLCLPIVSHGVPPNRVNLILRILTVRVHFSYNEAPIRDQGDL